MRGGPAASFEIDDDFVGWFAKCKIDFATNTNSIVGKVECKRTFDLRNPRTFDGWKSFIEAREKRTAFANEFGASEFVKRD